MSLFSSTSQLFKIFPLPEVLRVPVTGISIRDKSVYYLSLKPHLHYFKPDKFGLKDLPEGSLKRGAVENSRSLQEVLRAIRKTLPTPYVRVAIPESQSYLFSAEVPILSPSGTHEAIAFNLEEYIPLSAEDAVFDYSVTSTNPKRETRGVLVSAISKDTALKYYDALISSGLFPLSFEVECEASARALLPKGNADTFMLVDIGRVSSVISIVSKGQVHFTTTIDVGGVAIDAALKKSFGDSKKDLRALKCEEGVRPTKAGKEIISALGGVLSTLKDELQKRIIYWSSYHAEAVLPPVSKIIIFGEEAELRGMSEYLGNALNLEASLGNVWTNCCSLDDYVPPIGRCDSLSYASAVGLAMRRV